MSVDTSRFKRGLRAYASVSSRSLAELINQKALDVAVRAFRMTRPETGANANALQLRRNKINRELWQQKLTRVKLAKSGKRKGKFIQVGARIRSKKQLYAVNLILQKSRGRKGIKGLYGTEMRQAAGKWARRAQVSVGYLKVPWLRAVQLLVGRAKYKVSWSVLATGLARWGGNKGSTTHTVPARKDALSAVIDMTMKVRGPRQTVADKLMVQGAQAALDAEADTMLRRTANALKVSWEEVNGIV